MTRNLAGLLASIILAVSSGFLLPLLIDEGAAWVGLVVCVLVGLLPYVGVWLFSPPAMGGHTAIGAAAVSGGNYIECTNQTFAEKLATHSAGEVEVVKQSRRPPLYVAAGSICALLLFPLVWTTYHPPVRALNLGDEPIVVSVDGEVLGELRPTSNESPLAGSTFRVKFGQRHLSARTLDGQLVQSGRYTVSMGQAHLYVPAGEGYCFFLDTSAYGRSIPLEEARLLLDPRARFWLLPRPVDSWFSPNPPPDADRRSTGGVLTALRQTRCAESPEAQGSTKAGVIGKPTQTTILPPSP